MSNQRQTKNLGLNRSKDRERRISGGREGRSEGYDYELEIRDLINEHKEIGKTLIELKYNKRINEDLIKLKATKLPEGKAGDVKIEWNNLFVGVDSKKPTGSNSTQWVRKRIHLFLEKANEREKEVFLRYFKYDKPRHGKRVFSFFTKEEEKIMFDYIDKEKITMIKERLF